jgi:hypothetical protein
MKTEGRTNRTRSEPTMSAGAGRITYPFVLVFVVGTTWCFAWARSVCDESARGYWPAKDPELMRRVLAPETPGPARDRSTP